MAGKTVILCSYGPRKATHQSLRRLRAMLGEDDQLLVYAGSRAGAADAGKTKGVETVAAVGRDGLLEAMERTDNEAVLHLTDGVTLTAGGMRTLFRAMDETGKLVTPWTNDLGTDHCLGALPTHGNTVQVLTERGRRQPQAPVRVLRPVCIGGTSSQIAGLIPFHLAHPTTVLRLVHDDCIAVAGVAAAHNGSAEERLLAPVGPDGRPLVVATMIVRDEEQFLEDCLRSLEGFVDRIDLCDTGSTDRTLEIARAYGCNIIEREWRNDFGWARNEVLELGRDAWWSLWIDADERLVAPDPERIRRELATAIDHFQALDVVIDSGIDDGSATGIGRFTTTRFMRPDIMRFNGALHEQVVPRDPEAPRSTTALEGVELLHLGYSEAMVVDRDKRRRNLDIARTGYEQDPDDPVTALQYARSLRLAGAPPQERIEPIRTAHHGFSGAAANQRAYVAGLLAQTLTELDEHEEAWELAVEALDLVPSDDAAFAVLMHSGMRLDRLEEVLARHDAYARGPSLRPAMPDPKLRANNRAQAIRLLREHGRIEEALQHTTELVTESHREFPHWDLLFEGMLETHAPDELVTALHHMLTTTEDGTWARPLASRLHRELTLPLIEAHLEGGGRSVEPVRVGLTLAMVGGDRPTLERIAKNHGHLLSVPDREAMAARLREKGLVRAAELLAPSRGGEGFLV